MVTVQYTNQYDVYLLLHLLYVLYRCLTVSLVIIVSMVIAQYVYEYDVYLLLHLL